MVIERAADAGSRSMPGIVVLSVAIVAALALTAARAAESVHLLVLFETKALLYIDGERRMLAVDEISPEGVKLISVDSERAVIEAGGRRETLFLGSMTSFPSQTAEVDAPSWDGPERVSLWADDNGFFYASGSINGYPVKFLIDTGATTIAISSRLAEQIGVDLRRGRRGIATTAGGVTQMVGLKLDSVTVGGITLRDIDAGVLTGAFPETPLLGMSFLGQLDMLREGNRMDLKRRF